MPKQHVTHIRTIKRTYADAYVRLDGKRPVIYGDRDDSEILTAIAVDSPQELENLVLSAIQLLPGHSAKPMLLSFSGAQGIEITRDHGLCFYRIEVCVDGRWRRLHSKKAQRAIDHDLKRARKALAKAAALAESTETTSLTDDESSDAASSAPVPDVDGGVEHAE